MFASFLITAVYVLEVTANAGLGLSEKIHDSYPSSAARLTSQHVGTGTTVTAHVAIDWCHSGTAETTLC